MAPAASTWDWKRRAVAWSAVTMQSVCRDPYCKGIGEASPQATRLGPYGKPHHTSPQHTRLGLPTRRPCCGGQAHKR